MRTRPAIRYNHSLACGCQCGSRIAPGFRSAITPVMVVEIGNSLALTRRSSPPGQARGGLLSQQRIAVRLRRGSHHPLSWRIGPLGGNAPLGNVEFVLGELGEGRLRQAK